MILRLLRAMRSLAVEPRNYYRELVATNCGLRIGDPVDWLGFKVVVQREMAHRRRGVPGIETLEIDASFPGIRSQPVTLFPFHRSHSTSRGTN